MKLSDYPETDSLYIDLCEPASTESREISEAVILDYDADDKLVGICIDNARNLTQPVTRNTMHRSWKSCGQQSSLCE